MLIGVELRDGEVFGAAVAEDGAVTARASVDSRGADVVSTAISLVERITPASSGPSSLGVAAAPTDAASSRVLDALASRYSGLFQQRAILGPGTAAALAESWAGAARGARHVVYFAVGDHATAGFVRGGEPVVGANGREPAVGWLNLNPVEREDYRKAGCLEAEVAAAGIVRRLVWRIKAGDRSRVQERANGDLAAITSGMILEAARAKDGVSISVMRDTAKYLGMAAANLVVLCDPETLVLVERLAVARDLLLEPILWELGRRLPGPMMEGLKISTATLGADAPAIGAARYASLVSPA